MRRVSIVIPCYNNADMLALTVSAIDAAMAHVAPGIGYEMVLVDDASTDGTWSVITTLHGSERIDVRGFRLNRNVGAYSAVVVGMQHATGDAIIVMAADGDDPPHLLPQLIDLWNEGNLLVQAARAEDGGTPSPSWAGRLFYRILLLLGLRNIPALGCDHMLADRAVVDKALASGFRPGHTLIQLYQHAPSAAVLPYIKGRRPSRGWTTMKKLDLFLFTIISTFSHVWPLWMLTLAGLAACTMALVSGNVWDAVVGLLLMPCLLVLLMFLVRYAMAASKKSPAIVNEC